MVAQGGKITKFDTATCDALKHYVYCLVDPRNNEIFYVGKGQNNRVFDHDDKADGDSKDGGDTQVKQRIAEIKKSGHEIDRYVICHALDKDTAFNVESCVI